jgi:hypothetical protein
MRGSVAGSSVPAGCSFRLDRHVEVRPRRGDCPLVVDNPLSSSGVIGTCIRGGGIVGKGVISLLCGCSLWDMVGPFEE